MSNGPHRRAAADRSAAGRHGHLSVARPADRHDTGGAA